MVIYIDNRMNESAIWDTKLHKVKPCAICIGNHMDESVIWEKIARQQKNCTRRSRVLFELLYVSEILFPKSHSHPCDYLLIVMTYLH